MEIMARDLWQMIVTINPNMRPGRLGPDTDLFHMGALDSFGTMQLVLRLEEDLNLLFDYDDLRNQHFRTIRSLSELLVNKHGCKVSGLDDSWGD